MDRRRFLHSAAALGVSLAAGRRLLSFPAPMPGARAANDWDFEFELEELSVDELQRGMRTGRFTSRSLVESYLARISALDHAGMRLSSVLEINPEALDIARNLDAERRSRGARGPLHGIPVLIKDAIDTGDRMHTTAGSFALLGSRPQRDAFIVRRLRAAGAVILGKTNMSEWSNFRSLNGVAGWSARGGLTKNPYVLDQSASGSSSGTGAAIAANLAAVGIGVETDGSISGPAGVNCLVGVKPTLGMVSRSGLIPVSTTFDIPGPMCRSVRDAAQVLSVLAGVDPSDAETPAAGAHAIADYASALTADALRGARIGVVRGEFDESSRLGAVLDAAVAAMQSAGAEIVDDVSTPSLQPLHDPELQVLLTEFKAGIESYLATRGPEEKHRTLADLIRFNEENRDVEMRQFGQEFFELAASAGSLDSPSYQRALQDCRTVAGPRGIDAALQAHKLDALVALAASPNASLPALAGYPCVTVPAGYVSSVPVGIVFMGGAWTDTRLLRLSHAFEMETHVRQPPHFLATTTDR